MGDRKLVGKGWANVVSHVNKYLSDSEPASARLLGLKARACTVPPTLTEPISLASAKLCTRTVLSAPPMATRTLFLATVMARIVSAAPVKVRSLAALAVFQSFTDFSAPPVSTWVPLGVIPRAYSG